MNRPGPSDARIGVLALTAMVACCALPVLLSAGLVAGLGAVLLSPPLILAGIVLAIAAVGLTRRRHQTRGDDRRRNAADGRPVHR